jgi:hypothetical protein
MPKWNGGVIGVANNPTISSAKGIWSLSEATKAIRAGLWPPSNAGADPYFENVTMLLSANGTDGTNNSSFLDSSGNGLHPNRNGNTTQGTFTPFSKPDGRWGNYFDGTGDFLDIGSGYPSALNLGSSNFTIEFFVYPTSTSKQLALGNLNDGTGTKTFFLIMNSTGRYEFGLGSSAYNLGTGTVSTNTWVHVCVMRSGNNIQLFENGVQIGSTQTFSGSVTSQANQMRIGGAIGGQYPLSGYVSNVRMLIGTALYSTSGFSVPTAPLTAITNTSLLTCQSNRFIDNSTNAFAITRNGDVSIQTFSPFPTLTAYASGTNGGSGYFDVTGDTLSAGSNAAFALGTGDFTVETFAYYVAQSNVDAIAVANWDGVTWGSNKWSLHLDHTTARAKVTFWFHNYSSTVPLLTSTNTLTIGQWHHVAVSRSGNTFRLFINGVLDVSATNSTSLDGGNNSPIYVGGGGGGAGSQYFNGYLSSTRLVKGTAVYTATFTTPTAPLTAVSGTSLLLNFTNGGIVDAAMSNDLETVGGAQISTTQSKFGGASMYFDGNGDYLFVPNTNLSFNFGTGDFTIEGWVYLSATPSTAGTIIDARASDALTEYHTSVTASNKLDFIYSSSRVTSATSISNTTWTHFAITRSSGTIRLFINGTLDANTASYSGTVNAAATPAIGGGRAGLTSAINGYYFNGYIDDLRITKGYARYTANFTAPVGPFVGFGD